MHVHLKDGITYRDGGNLGSYTKFKSRTQHHGVGIEENISTIDGKYFMCKSFVVMWVEPAVTGRCTHSE